MGNTSLISVIGALIIGIMIGGLIVAYQYSILPNQILSYNQFVGILLACVTIVITLFGVFLAVLAFYGFSSIEDRVRQTSKETAQSTLELALAPDGELHKLTIREVTSIIYRRIGIAESSGSEDPTEDS